MSVMTDNNKKKNDDRWLPVAFYFRVDVGNEQIPFKEVSGLNVEMETEAVGEGGLNSYQHQLPKQIKHGNLMLKRAQLPVKSDFIKWIKSIMENDLLPPIETKDLNISLLDNTGNPIYTWLCGKAYPVKWDIDSLDSEKNSVLVETLEFAYSYLKRH
jgi:phage tail-like protein